MRPALRRLGWEERLEAAVNRRRSERFNLGGFDCLTFACSCVLAMTGVDVWYELKDRYNSKESALDFISQRGGLVQGLTDHFQRYGIVPCPVTCAQRGDVLLLPGHDGWPGTLAVCFGSVCGAPGVPFGLSFTSTLTASQAWHVETAPLCRN